MKKKISTEFENGKWGEVDDGWNMGWACFLLFMKEIYFK